MLRMCELIELAAARRFGSTRGDRWRETAQQFALAMPDFAWYRYGTETGKFVYPIVTGSAGGEERTESRRRGERGAGP